MSSPQSSVSVLKKACDRCTKVKAACDAVRPQCGRCTRIGVTDCTYRAPLKRGRRAHNSEEYRSDATASVAATVPTLGPTAPVQVSSLHGGTHPQGLHGAAVPVPASQAVSSSPFYPQPDACMFIPTAREMGYVDAFFESAGEMAAFVNRPRFTAALSKLQHPRSLPAAPLSPAEAERVGVLMLFDVIAGLGASVAKEREEARRYLHRAVGHISAATLQPSHFAVAAFALLSFAILWAYGPLSSAHAMVTHASCSMTRVLADAGQPCSIFLATTVMSNHAMLTRKAGLRFNFPLPQPADINAANDMLDLIMSGRLDLIPAPTGEAPAPSIGLITLANSEKLYGFKGRQLPPGVSVPDAAAILVAVADHLARLSAWSLQVSVHMATAAAAAAGTSSGPSAGTSGGVQVPGPAPSTPFDPIPPVILKGSLASLSVLQVMGRILAGMKVPVKVVLDCSAAMSAIAKGGNRLGEVARLLEVVQRTGLDETLSLVPDHLVHAFLCTLQECAACTAVMMSQVDLPTPFALLAHVANVADDVAAHDQSSHASDGPPSKKARSAEYALGLRHMTVPAFFEELEYGRAWMAAVREGAAAWAVLQPQVELKIAQLVRVQQKAETASSVTSAAGAAVLVHTGSGLSDLGLGPLRASPPPPPSVHGAASTSGLPDLWSEEQGSVGLPSPGGDVGMGMGLSLALGLGGTTTDVPHFLTDWATPLE